MNMTYEEFTEAAVRTIEMLTIQSHTNPADDNQLWWERARGAVGFWKEVAGPEARPDDIERIQLLLDAMPGADDEGEGNWHLTPVMHM
jgi:hypothetical protein